ncbi:hypothetical protein CVS40_11668 [Lucilia cuprina]|nr:hypothetical protein CVS40_11668 [Lucilia cuprina]
MYKNNKIKNKNILYTVLTLLAIISPVRSLVKINNFKNEAGIFFDRVATVGLTKTSWSITVHINISEYTTAMNSLSEAMMSLGKLETKEAVFQSSSY